MGFLQNVKRRCEEQRGLPGDKNTKIRIIFGFLFSLAFSAGLVYYLNTRAPIKYVINDDCAFELMLSGAYGSSAGYDIFQNIVFGKVISALFALLPTVNWYSVALMGIFCLSFSVFGTYFIEKLGFVIGIPLDIAVDLVFETTLLYQFQWTVCAYVAMAAGIVLFIWGDRSEKRKRIWRFILSGLFFSLAFMIRWNVILPAAVLTGAYCVVALLEKKKRAVASAAAFCAICGVIAGLYGVNALAYTCDPQWRAYEEYNSVRSELVDFLRPDYAENEAVYQSVGWSQNDCDMFLSFITPDDGKFSTENLEKIAEAVSSSRTVNLKEAVVKLGQDISQFRHTQVSCFVILFSLLFALCFNEKKILPIGLAASAFLFHMVLILMNRNLDRVVFPQYATTAILMLCILDFDAAEAKLGIVPGKLGPGIRMKAFALLLVLSVFLPKSMVNYQVDTALDGIQENNSIALYDEYVKENPQNVYVMVPNGLYSRNSYYSLFTVPEKDSLKNAFPVGGWEQRTKYYYEFEERYGIDNILQDLLTKENYYIAPLNYGDFLRTYIYENYGISVEFQTIYQAGDIQICKVVKTS